MKAVILAGGKGSRLSGYTDTVPKPLVRIDKYPILLHIMDIYASYGVTEFVILAGHKGEQIRNFFSNFQDYVGDFTINLGTRKLSPHLNHTIREWDVTVLDTGEETMTGGRLLRAKSFLNEEERFFLTYGDGLANVDMDSLLHHHLETAATATVTAVPQPGRFGVINLSNGRATSFNEKPRNDGSLINGGYFVFENQIFDYLTDDSTVLESQPLEKLASEGELAAFKHGGYWRCMDTARDVISMQQDAMLNPKPWLDRLA